MRRLIVPPIEHASSWLADVAVLVAVCKRVVLLPFPHLLRTILPVAVVVAGAAVVREPPIRQRRKLRFVPPRRSAEFGMSCMPRPSNHRVSCSRKYMFTRDVNFFVKK